MEREELKHQLGSAGVDPPTLAIIMPEIDVYLENWLAEQRVQIINDVMLVKPDPGWAGDPCVKAFKAGVAESVAAIRRKVADDAGNS